MKSPTACVKRPTNAHYVFYKEDAASIQMDLSGMAGPQSAVAVDAKLPYSEINLGNPQPYGSNLVGSVPV